MYRTVFESELKVLSLLWQFGNLSIVELAERLHQQVGWSKTTTYTVVKKCIEKNLICRSQGAGKVYVCSPLITKEDVQNEQTDTLIDRFYDGEVEQLVASLVGRYKVMPDQLARILKLIDSDA